jgi:DHA1 family multidrug resistance protein-like MFS transporter
MALVPLGRRHLVRVERFRPASSRARLLCRMSERTTDARQPGWRAGSKGPAGKLARIYLLILLFTLGEGGLRFLVPVHLDGHGASLVAIGTVTSAFGIATLVARLPAGLLYRPAHARSLILVSGSASAVAFLLVAFATRVDVVLVLMVVDGFGWGVATTLLLTIVLGTRAGGTSSSSTMGWYVGVQGVGHALAGVTGGLLGDAVGLRGAFLVLAGVLLFATLGIGWSLPRVLDGATVGAQPSTASPWLRIARGLPLPVWIAALAGLYLNVMNSIMNTFFPILALTLGFTLSQAGLLVGMRSGVSAIARFASIPLFQRVPSRRLRLPLLTLSALTTGLVGTTGVFSLQAPLWMLNGASRGLIRVGTGADAMDSLSDGQEGLAAAFMSTGLDLGKVVGPLLAGVVADGLGMASAFYIVPTLFFALYVCLEAAERRRGRPRPVEPERNPSGHH